MEQRYIEILYTLMDAKDPMPLRVMGQRFGVTDRAIRYDLRLIDEVLIMQALPVLQRNSSGIAMVTDAEQNEKLLSFLQSCGLESSYAHQRERARRIELELLFSNGYTTISYLSDTLNVSRSTVVNDLRQLKDGGLPAARAKGYPRKGYKLDAPECDRRMRIVELLLELVPVSDLVDYLFRNVPDRPQVLVALSRLPFFSKEELTLCARMAAEMEERLGAVWSDRSILLVTFAILVCLLRGRLRDIPSLSMDDGICRTRDFGMVEALLLEWQNESHARPTTEDIKFVTMYTLCAETNNISYYKKENHIRIQLCASQILRSLCDTLNVTLLAADSLHDRLSEYLSHSYYRVIHHFVPLPGGITRPDCTLEKIQKALPGALKCFKELCGKPVPREEADGIAMLFYEAYTLESSNKAVYFRTAVVLDGGSSYSGLFLSALARNFPQIDVVAVLTRHQLPYYNVVDNLDFLVTTRPLHLDGVTEFVIPNTEVMKGDAKLRHYLSTNQPRQKSFAGGTRTLLQNVLRVAACVCEREVYDRFVEELSGKIGPVEHNYYQGETTVMLKDILPEENILLGVSATDWEDAVRKGGQILVDRTCVEPGFVEAMLRLVRENGPYIVMTPGVALPHARPEDGVRNMGMSLIRLDRPVRFGHEDNDPVDIVISLAATDNSSHLEALAELFALLGDKQQRQVFSQARSPEEITGMFQ